MLFQTTSEKNLVAKTSKVQTTSEKNLVAKTSKELVCFFCRSAKFAVLQLLFSGSVEVAAGLSNESGPLTLPECSRRIGDPSVVDGVGK